MCQSFHHGNPALLAARGDKSRSGLHGARGGLLQALPNLPLRSREQQLPSLGRAGEVMMDSGTWHRGLEMGSAALVLAAAVRDSLFRACSGWECFINSKQPLTLFTLP